MTQTASGITYWAVNAQVNDEDSPSHVIILEETPELLHAMKEVAYAVAPFTLEGRLPVKVTEVSFRVGGVAQVFRYDEFVQAMQDAYPGWSGDALSDGVPCRVPADVVSALRERLGDDWVACPRIWCEKITLGNLSGSSTFSACWEGYDRDTGTRYTSWAFDRNE